MPFMLNQGGRVRGSSLTGADDVDGLRTTHLRTRTPKRGSRREKTGLWVLKAKPPDVPDLVDIVAVHGLGGDAFDTWTGKDGTLWLRDLLPSRIPNARVMTYGYNSQMAFTTPAKTIKHYAANLLYRLDLQRTSNQDSLEELRPIIFVCHSLGGIIVKKALILAHEQDKTYGHLLECVKGIVFMGTPHRGSSLANTATLFVRLVENTPFLETTRSELVQALQKDSDVLSEITEQFINRASTLQIVSFYETKKFPGLNRPIVQEESALLRLPNEIPAAIEADHSSMVKFTREDAQIYETVSNELQRMILRFNRRQNKSGLSRSLSVRTTQTSSDTQIDKSLVSSEALVQKGYEFSDCGRGHFHLRGCRLTEDQELELYSLTQDLHYSQMQATESKTKLSEPRFASAVEMSRTPSSSSDTFRHRDGFPSWISDILDAKSYSGAIDWHLILQVLDRESLWDDQRRVDEAIWRLARKLVFRVARHEVVFRMMDDSDVDWRESNIHFEYGPGGEEAAEQRVEQLLSATVEEHQEDPTTGYTGFSDNEIDLLLSRFNEDVTRESWMADGWKEVVFTHT